MECCQCQVVQMQVQRMILRRAISEYSRISATMPETTSMRPLVFCIS